MRDVTELRLRAEPTGQKANRVRQRATVRMSTMMDTFSEGAGLAAER